MTFIMGTRKITKKIANMDKQIILTEQEQELLLHTLQQECEKDALIGNLYSKTALKVMDNIIIKLTEAKIYG